MKKKWKKILGALLLLVIIAFVVSQTLQGVEVEVKEVTSREIARSFTEQGTVKAQEEHTVYSMFGGRVAALPVSEGDRVEEGELLIALEDEEIEHTLSQLHAELKGLEGEELKLTEEPGQAQVKRLELGVEQAREGLDKATRNYERNASLYESQAISLVELEEAESMLKEAKYALGKQEQALAALYESYQAPRGSREIIEGQRAAIHSQLDLYQYKKDNYRIYAPFSGIVGNIETREKELVNPQAPVMAFYHKEDYLVETMVLTRDVFDIYEGMTIDLILEQRNQDVMFTGEVSAIAPYAEKDLSPLGLEEERVKITILPDVPEALKIGPGYRVDVEFTTSREANALAVPLTSLFTYKGEDALLVVEEGEVRVRRVTTGMETRRDVVITDGLQEGDLVITDPRKNDLAQGGKVSYSIINGGSGQDEEG